MTDQQIADLGPAFGSYLGRYRGFPKPPDNGQLRNS